MIADNRLIIIADMDRMEIMNRQTANNIFSYKRIIANGVEELA